MAFKHTTPGKVLLLTIMNDIYSLNCFTIHKVYFCLFIYLKTLFRIRIPRVQIRIQNLRLNTDPDPDLIRIKGFDDQKLKKITVEKIKNCNLLIPRPPQRMSKLQEKPSALKREHPAF
jgi:hypothetical protein